MRVDYVFAWLLPLFAGAGVCWLAGGAARFRGHPAAALGAGWIVGLMLVAACVRQTVQAGTPHAFSQALPWVVALAASAWALAGLRWWRARPGPPAAVVPAPRVATAWRFLWWLLLAMIVARLLLLGDEASLRPVFPWDAWSAWAIKPKTWMLLGHVEPYVPMSDWLANAPDATRTAATWNYPEWLAWIQLWFASAAGGWNEPLVDIAWCGALAAFALAAYGYWRGIGLAPCVAIALVYALVSLPLVDAHVALAGYADLWVALVLGLSTLAWSRWLLFRERGQWLLAAGLALCLPAIKLEGAIWLLAFSAVAVLDLLPARWRWKVAGMAVFAVALGLMLGGFSLPMLGLGWVRVAWGSVTIPGVATFELTWHTVGGAMLASLFTLPNWHLLWYLLPPLLLWRWRAMKHGHAARLLGVLVLLQALFLFVLFFFTSAAAWAADFTSSNRLILQVVPTVFVLVAVLLRDAGDGRAGGGGSPAPG